MVGSGRRDDVMTRADERRCQLAATAERLGSEREARWIVEHVEGEARSRLPGAGRLHDEERIGWIEELVTRRVRGEPLQYVLGRWPFRSLELKVDRRVLIPRPETEQVVEVALAELDRMHRGMTELDRMHRGKTSESSHRRAGAADGPSSVFLPVCVDMGTGSGAIGLSLAVEGGLRFEHIEVWATDASADALAVARRNVAELSAVDPRVGSRVCLAEGQWFGALPDRIKGRIDLLVSNPPYVSESEYASLEPGIREWEPRGALVASAGTGGVGGMADIEEIVAGAPSWLGPQGTLIVELSPLQADAALEVARRAGFAHVTTRPDLAGRTRMLVGRRSG